MNETEKLQAPSPLPAPEVKPAKPRRSAWPLLGFLGFLILAAGEGYLWKLHQSAPDYAPQMAALQAQVTELQQTGAKIQPAPDSVIVQADLGMKLAALSAQVAAIQAQVAADHGALTTLQANNTDLTKLSARIEVLNRLESVRMALDEGQPLGDIPNAPPALAKFAEVAPPTQAALQLAFPQAARAAADASVAKAQSGSFWSGVLARFENLITISNGPKVIVGAPAAAILNQAKDLLDAGDLNGALTVLDGLSPSTQAAMGDWLNQARDLSAARAAIINLAGQG
jgi:hypothetical protein